MRKLRFPARPSFSTVLVLVVGLVFLACDDNSPQNNFTLTVGASPSQGGTVSRSPDMSQYESGTVVTLTANPNYGYDFDRWEGDATGQTNPITVTVDANKNVTAFFTATGVPAHLVK